MVCRGSEYVPRSWTTQMLSNCVERPVETASHSWTQLDSWTKRDENVILAIYRFHNLEIPPTFSSSTCEDGVRRCFVISPPPAQSPWPSRGHEPEHQERHLTSSSRYTPVPCPAATRGRW